MKRKVIDLFDTITWGVDHFKLVVQLIIAMSLILLNFIIVLFGWQPGRREATVTPSYFIREIMLALVISVLVMLRLIFMQCLIWYVKNNL